MSSGFFKAIFFGVFSLLWFGGTGVSVAEELDPWDLKALEESLMSIPKANRTPVLSCSEQMGQPCSELSDWFCDRVWSTSASGNLDLATGKVRMGRSKKSDISEAYLANVRALVDSEERLPKDLQVRVRPLFVQIRKHLKNERAGMAWIERLEDLEMRVAKVISDVSEGRTLKAHPELKKVEEPSIDQAGFYQTEYLKLREQLIQAKYGQHPHWQRVVRVYEQVKKDLLEEVETFRIPVAAKKRIIAKLKKTPLVLPPYDPQLNSKHANCGSTEVGAFYSPSKGYFTVCAGWFNSYQDDSSMYNVIAHELAHSFDPGEYIFDEFLETSTGKALETFCHAKGAVFSCDLWKQLVSTVLTPAPLIKEPNPPFRQLTRCLSPEGNLKPFDDQMLRNEAEALARQLIAQSTNENEFTLLAQPVRNEGEREVPNPYYFRPDQVRKQANDRVEPVGRCYFDVVPEVFTQSLSCNGYQSASQEARADHFQSAADQTHKVLTALYTRWFASCGRDCPELRRSQMGRPSAEVFADWVAHRVFKRHLAREKDLQKRREMIALSEVSNCVPPGPLANASDLTRTESGFSGEPHPDARVRRMSMFTSEIIKLVHCAPDDDVKKEAGACEL